jgi:predicted nucleic acid-binding protein
VSVPVVYADASALVKLVLDEAESDALRAYLAGAGVVTCDLALTEVPRAIRRASATDPSLPLEGLLARAGEVLEAVGLLPLDRAILIEAGAIAEPGLRALDAVHVAAAVSLGPIDAFVTYDERQAAAARLAGLRVVAPGA